MTIEYIEKIGAEMDVYQDRFWLENALADTGTITTEPFCFARVGGGVELAVFATSAYTLTADLTFATSASDTEDTGYSPVDTKVFASGAVVKGQELYRFAPDSNTALYAKVAVTTTTDESANKITGKILERRGS